MQIKVTKTELIDMLKGCKIGSYEKIGHLENLGVGHWQDQYGRFAWVDSELMKMSEEEIYVLYLLLRK